MVWSLPSTFSPWNVAGWPLTACCAPFCVKRSSGTTVTTAFLFMYFSGNVALTVAVTCPASASKGFGVTLKLSLVSCPNFPEHEVKSSTPRPKINPFVFI